MNQLVTQDASSINETVSGFLDYGRKDVKAFIQEFIEKIQAQNRYDEQAKAV